MIYDHLKKTMDQIEGNMMTDETLPLCNPCNQFNSCNLFNNFVPFGLIWCCLALFGAKKFIVL
jgi:hypothetical protein